MRRSLLLILVMLFTTVSAYAQQAGEEAGEPLLSKRGQEIHPEAGDFGLGFDAVPILEYLGNIFNNTVGNTVQADFPGFTQQIFGKYFLTDQMAVRGRVRLGHDRIASRNRVILDNQTIPDPDVEVTDEWVSNETDARIGGGIEFRRGTGRVVGVFGGEVSFLYSRERTTYDYGNPINQSNQAPTSTFGGVVNGRFERIVDDRSEKEIGVGVNGFAGVEYFVGPNLSVGAEFTLGVDFMKDYRTEETNEFWDATSSSVQTRSTVEAGDNALMLDTGNYGGSINLMFYF